MMTLPENTLLKNGKYRIVRNIGQGGYGMTYLATTVEEVRGEIGTFSVNVPVAVKEFFAKTYCVRDPLTSDVLVPTAEGQEQVPRLKRDFEREATSMSQMSHPNIVRVIDVFEDHQTVYYVMQYLEGCSLADKVGGSGPLSPETAQRYIFQVAGAVAYLHDQHLCHYDIKPSNIMIADGDHAVLIDFGISRHYDEQGESTTSRPIGYSSGFSSPEQRMGDIHQFSPSSDIYSLAATLLYMLTGEVPSDAGEMSVPSQIPSDMRSAVAAGMKTDRNERPQTVKAWLAMLDDTTATQPRQNGGEDGEKVLKPGKVVQPRVEKTPEPQQFPQDSPGHRRFLKPLAIFLLSFVIGFTVWFFFFRNTGDSMPGSHPPKNGKTEVTDMKWTKKNRYGNTYVYTGTAVGNIPEGHGKAEYSDGSLYEGNFQDGLREDSKAVFVDSNGNKFTGEFRHDSIVKGRITAPDGRYYEGRFSDDRPYDGIWHDAGGKVMYRVERGKLISME